MALSGGSASAVSFVDDQGVLQGMGVVNTSSTPDFVTLSVDIAWTQTSVTQFLDFTITTVGDLFFTDYVNGDQPVSTANFDRSSSLTLDLLD